MRHSRQKAILKAATANIFEIAKRGDLKTRNSDSEDFFDIAVWCLKKALEDAYDAGRASQTPTDEIKKAVRSLMDDNADNLTDPADVYAQGYHDALLDIMDKFGIYHSEKHFE